MKTIYFLIFALTFSRVTAAPLFLVFNEPTNAVSSGATEYQAYFQTNSTTLSFASCGVGTNVIAFDSTNIPAQCVITMVTTDGVNYSASTSPLAYNQGQFVLQPPGQVHIQRTHP